MDRIYDLFFDHRVSPRDLEVGDHVYRWSSVQGCWRIPTHSHHGIVVEKNGNSLKDIQIVEFMQDSDGIIKVRQVDAPTFLEKGISHSLRRVQYEDNFYWLKRAGTSSPLKPQDPEEVVNRALGLLPPPQRELNTSTDSILFGAYKSKKIRRPRPWRTVSCDAVSQPWNILVNNCECVARWCKVGEWSSDQATSYVHWMTTLFVDFLLAFFTSGTTECIAETIEDQLVPINPSFTAIFYGNMIGELIAGLLESLVLRYAGMDIKDFRLHTQRMLFRRLLSFLVFTLLEAVTGPIGSKFILRLLFAHVVFQLAITKDLRLSVPVPLFIKGSLVL